MSNTLSFFLGIIFAALILTLISILSRSSNSVAKYYQPYACNGVIGN
jgi:hypothetical protein